MGEKSEFRDRSAPDQVFLDDPLEDGGRAGPVPDALGIDHGDGPLGANLQAIGLGSGHPGVGAGETEFTKTAFEEFPRLQSTGVLTAFRLGLVGAEQDVARDRRKSDVTHRPLQAGRDVVGGGGIRHAGSVVAVPTGERVKKCPNP